ncbi:MAG: methionine synthase [Elainella sp. C42_A2020_010]|nr:methionine synthase [Elainella sp. C42_A2020_010]
MRGIYIVANDRVSENAIALLSSIRAYDDQVPVYLIPFDDQYQQVAATLAELYQVQVFPDLEFLEQFTQTIGQIFDRDFLRLPNKMRKLIAWFGPLEEFLYIDTDILVFQKIAEVLDYLSEYDFLCCDYHHAGEGLKNVFSELVREQGIFSEAQLQDVFNSGFWGSKTGVISEAQMYELLRECAAHREYFDFSQQTTDQPILNYLVLKAMPKRLNLVRTMENAPGSWAGSAHFQEKNGKLYDRERPLWYLHWAGIAMRPGSPYRSLWEYYRYRNQAKSEFIAPLSPSKPLWQRALAKLTAKK